MLRDHFQRQFFNKTDLHKTKDKARHTSKLDSENSKLDVQPRNYNIFVIETILTFIWDLWLLTESDFLTFIVPNYAFGIFGALGGPLLLNNADVPLDVLASSLSVVIFNWSNVVIFDLANQRLPESIEEDRINKPHRPLPSGRMTPQSARRILLTSLPIVFIINYFLGPWMETLLLFVLTWMYNDLGGSDEDFVIRNLIISFAFALYNSSSLRIAGGPNLSINEQGVIWTAIISLVIFTTMHLQDMKDQEGDRSRGRKTPPIVLGDFVARGTIATPIAAWSIICPWFWYSGFEGYIMIFPLGAYIIWNLYTDRTFQGDRATWKLWSLWIALLYLLPIVKQLNSLNFMID